MSDMRFTVGDLKRHLERLKQSDIIEFDGGLTFGGIKRRGDDLHVLEFCEPQAHLGEDFTKLNPHVQVAFVKVADEPEDAVSSINVSIW